jgi:hypothetical protein
LPDHLSYCPTKFGYRLLAMRAALAIPPLPR